VSDQLAGKTALVVGGGQTEGVTTGNGRAAAMTYARGGAQVVVADRDLAAAEATCEIIRSENGTAYAVQADIAIDTDCRSMVATAIEKLGWIDILHNNVGITPVGRIEEIDLATWQRGLDINLTGVWSTCRYVLPHMRERRRGAVVTISSIAGLAAGPEVLAYATSKAALNAMNRSLALEYAPYGVRINTIAPGMVDTPVGIDRVARATGVDREEIATARAGLVPLAHRGTAWDVANAALFLASDAAAFVTGVVLPVDGGSTLLSGGGSVPKPAANTASG
jgi:NAD(P)-dependent dehydrogenase (short-subunit alcohol dehydrogenase family)